MQVASLITDDDFKYTGRSKEDCTCDLCGNRATAYWSSDSKIFVCARCATNILPRLIADATIRKYSQYGVYLSVLEKVVVNFKEAVIVILTRHP